MNILIRYIFALFYKYFTFFKERRFVKTKDFSSKEGIRFSGDSIKSSGDSIKSCVGFIYLIESPKNTMTMEGLEYIRKYYSTFINSVSDEIKRYGGKIIKNLGDSIYFYFPKTSESNNLEPFKEAIECGLRILDARHSVNQELSKQYLSPFNYKISMDYGVLDLALVDDYSQIDLFGSTWYICFKIIASSWSTPNTLIIGENFYRILKSFSSIMNNYNFINNGEYHITENNLYSIYTIKRKNDVKLNDTEGIC